MKIKTSIYSLVVSAMLAMPATGYSQNNDTSGPAQQETVTDKDGNVYHTIKIGTQTWMVENLKTTRYRNGDPIPNIPKNTAWADLRVGEYCIYNNDAANKTTFGVLYNWYAVSDSRKIAPAGWHIPSEAEWAKLTTFLGGKNYAGGKLKEALTKHWSEPNSGATNSSGFTALPGGYRNSDGEFSNIAVVGGWWTSTEYSKTVAWYRYTDYGTSNIYSCSGFKNSGFPIRCIKD